MCPQFSILDSRDVGRPDYWRRTTRPHLAEHRRCGGEVFPGFPLSIGALVERAEAEVAVGDERAHIKFLGQHPVRLPTAVPRTNCFQRIRRLDDDLLDVLGIWW
jgi:hypothetical protein